MKKAFLDAFLLSLLLVLFIANFGAPSVKADSSEPISFSSGVTIFSPVNTTYSSRFLTLNLTFNAGLGVETSLNYSIDGKHEGPIALVAKNPGEIHVVNPTVGVEALPELSNGSHSLVVNVLSGIYDYHGANPPRAPFKQTAPGSSDYVASWTHTVYFTVNSPMPYSSSQTSTPTPSPAQPSSPTPSIVISPSPSIPEFPSWAILPILLVSFGLVCIAKGCLPIKKKRRAV